jgi:hypothetical protein
VAGLEEDHDAQKWLFMANSAAGFNPNIHVQVCENFSEQD